MYWPQILRKQLNNDIVDHMENGLEWTVVGVSVGDSVPLSSVLQIRKFSFSHLLRYTRYGIDVQTNDSRRRLPPYC